MRGWHSHRRDTARCVLTDLRVWSSRAAMSLDYVIAGLCDWYARSRDSLFERTLVAIHPLVRSWCHCAEAALPCAATEVVDDRFWVLGQSAKHTIGQSVNQPSIQSVNQVIWQSSSVHKAGFIAHQQIISPTKTALGH